MVNILAVPLKRDALEGRTVNRALVDLTELIVSVVVPEFLTVTVSVFVLPTGTSPIETFLESTVKSPLKAAGTFSPDLPPAGEKETSEVLAGVTVRST